MNEKIFILIAMIFCHIIDDYRLQGILASMKQHNWWRRQEDYNDKYKHDYIMALFMHSFSWAFMIMIVPVLLAETLHGWYLIIFIFNTLMHMLVDDMKANRKMINLVQDQCIHIFQIVMTWACMMFL